MFVRVLSAHIYVCYVRACSLQRSKMASVCLGLGLHLQCGCWELRSCLRAVSALYHGAKALAPQRVI